MISDFDIISLSTANGENNKIMEKNDTGFTLPFNTCWGYKKSKRGYDVTNVNTFPIDHCIIGHFDTKKEACEWCRNMSGVEETWHNGKIVYRSFHDGKSVLCDELGNIVNVIE